MGVYEELGVKRIINAHNDMTNLGGSLIPPEVVEAWVAASKSFVNLYQLHWAAGQAAAKLVGAEMALVTGGAAAAMATAAATCLVVRNNLTDPEEMRARLPHSEGLANQIAIPRSHRNVYAQAFQVAGGRLVEFGQPSGFTEADLEGAITDQTAAVAFILSSGRTGTQQDVGSLGRVVEIVHRRGLPVIVDAAGELPPRRHIAEILATGVDLICFSGGKDIHGPNDTGFLFGKLALLEVAHQELICPHHQVLRAMKATKEDVVAAVAALKRYMALDEPARYAKWEGIVRRWMAAIADLPHVRAECVWPKEGEWHSQGWPRLRVTLDEEALGRTAQDIVQALVDGDPPIYVPGARMPGVRRTGYADLRGSPAFTMVPAHVQDDEVEIVCARLRELLSLTPPDRMAGR